MLPTQVRTTQARVTPARQRSTSQKRDHQLISAYSSTTSLKLRSNSQNMDPKKVNATGNKSPSQAKLKQVNKMIPPTMTADKAKKRTQSSPVSSKQQPLKKKLNADLPFLAQQVENIQNTKTDETQGAAIQKLQIQGGGALMSFHETLSSVQTENVASSTQSLDLARCIFEKAAKKYGTKLTHRQVDSIIRRSEKAGQVDKMARKFLKAILLNFERNGGNAIQAVQHEMIKQKCSQVARDHYRRSLLSKSFCAFIKIMIYDGNQDPQKYYNGEPGSAQNGTLCRMLEGVISLSRQDQLDEFIQLEKTLETEISDALISEPGITSSKKIHVQNDKSPPISTNLLNLNQRTLNQNSNKNSGFKLASGVQSPSVQDLPGEFQAFSCQNQSPSALKLSNSPTRQSSSLNMSDTLPSEGNETSKNEQSKANDLAPFFLGQDIPDKSLHQGYDGEPIKATHLKLAQLFRTTVQSSVGTPTHIDEQIKRLGQIEDFGCDEAIKTQEELYEIKNLMASYMNKQSLLRKGLAALTQSKNKDVSKARRPSSKDKSANRRPSQKKEKRMRDNTSQLQKRGSCERSNGQEDQKKQHTKESQKSTKDNKKSVSKQFDEFDMEQEAPVRQQRKQRNMSSNSLDTNTNQEVNNAPVFSSGLSSPYNRLQNILTDKEPTYYKPNTQKQRSKSRNGSPIGPQKNQEWQSQEKRKLLNLEQSGVHLREKSLKRQIFKNLEYNVHMTKQNERKADDFFKHRFIKSLRHYLYEKNKIKKILELYAQSRVEKRVSNAFRNWRGRYFENQVVAQFRNEALMKQAFSYFVKGTIQEQQSRQISIVCKKHFQGKMIKRIFYHWNQSVKSHQPKRQRIQALKRHMQEYRMTKIVKAWFNQIDLLKHEQALQRDVLQSRCTRLRRHYFVVWLQRYLKIAKRRDRLDKLAKFSQENFARQFFSPWLKLAKIKQQKRQKFFETRAKNLIKRALLALRENLYNSTGERQKARKVIMMRATRLIKTAFYGGFVNNVKIREVEKQRKLLAQSHLHAQTIIKSFQAFKINTKLGRNAKILRQKSNFLAIATLFSDWHLLSKNVIKAKRMRTRVLVEKQFQVIKILFENANRNRIHSKIVRHCLNKYSMRLLQTSFAVFQDNICSQQAKRGIVNQIVGYYSRKIKSKAIEAMKINQIQRKEYARVITKFQLSQMDSQLQFSFNKIKANRVHQQFKRSYLPFLERRKEITKEQCIFALRDWKINRIAIKNKLSAHMSYRQECMVENAFESLVFFTQNSKIKKEQQDRADEHRQASLQNKVVQTLVFHKICMKNQKTLIKDVQKIRRKMLFINWYNIVHDELPAQRKADEFYIMKKFTAMRDLAVQNRGLRAKRILLKQLSAEYYPYMLKKRGVCKWRAVAERTTFVAESLLKHKKNRLRKLFNGWWNNVDRLADSKSRLIMQNELYKRFQYRRVLTSLKIFTDAKQHQNKIVKVFQNKHNMIEKAKVFSAIIQQNYQDKVNARKLLERLIPSGQRTLADAFKSWHTNMIPARSYDMADLFYERRASKFILRKCFDKLRSGSLALKKKDIKDQWLDKVHANQLLRRCFNDLCIYAKTNIKLQHAYSIANGRKEERLKKKTMHALEINIVESQRLNGIEGSIIQAFNKIRLRKVIIALQNYTAQSVKAKIVTAKYQMRIKDKLFQRWQEQQYNHSKLDRLYSILQDQNDLKFIRAFMLKLQDAGTFMMYRKSLDSKLKSKALQCLKQQWLLGKMQNSLVQRHQVDLMRKVFTALKYNQHERLNLRETIMQQADLQNNEDQFDLLRTCFEALKEVRFKSKAKRVARGTFGLCILKKAFTSFRQFTLKQKLLQVSFNETVILRKQKYLHMMFTEYDRRQREREAEAIINFDRVHSVMQAWKKFTHDEKLIRQFRKQTYIRALKQSAIASLQKNVIIENFQRFMYQRIQLRQNIELKRDAFTALRNGLKLQAIQSNMKVYHLHKFQRKFIKAWKLVVENKNRQRLNLIKQRAILQEKPQLAKPLLAMRNFLMFKAFRSIMLQASQRQEIRFNKQICTYSIYLRIQRKAFYALRLNAAARYQKKKSKEIKKLMIQRRWFKYLKSVTQKLKIQRKKQTDAAIFRFLSLQRRALLQWVSFISKMKRVKIKRHFSLSLYYNRMCDKVFTALKVNAQVKGRKRRETSQASGYITTSSSEIMHEASFTHRTKLNLSSLQQFVNSSTQLREELAQANVAAQGISSINRTSLSNRQMLQQEQQFNQMTSEPQVQDHMSYQQQQPHLLTQLNNPSSIEFDQQAMQIYQQYGSRNDHQDRPKNFYQYPIDQVERAQNLPQSQEHLINPLISELQHLGNNQHMYLVQTSLPTPQGGQQDLKNQNPTSYTNLHQYDQPKQVFQTGGDLSPPQQLTLGTMPDLIHQPSQQAMVINDTSSATHQHEQQPTESQYTQQWMASFSNCQLCEEGVSHNHNVATNSQSQISPNTATNEINSHHQQQQQQNSNLQHLQMLMVQNQQLQQHIQLQEQQHQNSYQSDEIAVKDVVDRNQQADVQKVQTNDDCGLSSFDVRFNDDISGGTPSPLAAYHMQANENQNDHALQVNEFDGNHLISGVEDDEVPERDFNPGLASFNGIENQQQEQSQEEMLSQEMFQELINSDEAGVSGNRYDAENASEIQKKIQLNMNMDVISSQSRLVGERSTPDINRMMYRNNHQNPADHDDQYMLVYQEEDMQQHAGFNTTPLASGGNKTNPQTVTKLSSKVAYSHSSSLKTTPGMVRSKKITKEY